MLQMYIKKGRLKEFWLLNVVWGMMLLLNDEGIIAHPSVVAKARMGADGRGEMRVLAFIVGAEACKLE